MVVILDKKLRKELQRLPKLWVWCDVKGCLEGKEIEWDGGFINKWRCDYHTNKTEENKQHGRS